MSPEQEIIWLAGLLEGEGSFSQHKGSPVIHLAMTDRDIVVRAAEIMSCSHGILTRNKDRKQAWQTSAWGLKAVLIMRKILPYMGERRSARINELLSLYGDKNFRRSVA